VDGGGTGDEINVGDVDLEFLHASSCYSADDDNLNGIRFALHDPVDGGFAHQWDGFHGLMWIGGGFDDDYNDFAHDAPLFVDRLRVGPRTCTATTASDCDDPPCDDECPIAYSISSTGSGALTRLINERYNFVYSDPPGNSAYAYMYYAGCDPLGESTFAP